MSSCLMASGQSSAALREAAGCGQGGRGPLTWASSHPCCPGWREGAALPIGPAYGPGLSGLAVRDQPAQWFSGWPRGSTASASLRNLLDVQILRPPPPNLLGVGSGNLSTSFPSDSDRSSTDSRQTHPTLCPGTATVWLWEWASGCTSLCIKFPTCRLRVAG